MRSIFAANGILNLFHVRILFSLLLMWSTFFACLWLESVVQKDIQKRFQSNEFYALVTKGEKKCNSGIADICIIKTFAFKLFKLNFEIFQSFWNLRKNIHQSKIAKHYLTGTCAEYVMHANYTFLVIYDVNNTCFWCYIFKKKSILRFSVYLSVVEWSFVNWYAPV